MQIRYEIYQIEKPKDENGNTTRLYAELSEEITEVDLKKDCYKKVFEGSLEPRTKRRFNPKYALDYILETFNMNRPLEYNARRISVSDIIKLQDKYYHCQCVGWKEINII